MRRSIKRALKRALLSILVIGFALLAMPAYRSLSGPALQPWHTFVPMDDPLYGMHPDPKAKGDCGYNLGAMAARGERGALIVDPS